MREQASVYKFEHGLRQYGDGSEVGLSECYNVIPRRKMLVAHDPIITVPSITMDWPYPQLFCLAGGNYLCGRNYIKTLDASLAVTSTLVTLPSAMPWTVVDFWQYVIFCNGAAMYATDLAGGVQPLSIEGVPRVRAVSHFKGQLIGLEVTGYTPNQVVYGAIGSANFSVDAVECGSAPMKWQGGNVAALRLGDRLVIYGEGGIGVLEIAGTDVIAFKNIDVLPSSIQRLGVCAVGGDDSLHCFLDETGSLWKMAADFSVQELGYREFLEGMLDGDVQISFDPRSLFRDFYICDGTKCYLLSEGGLAEVHQIVSSIQLYRGGSVGTFIDNGDASWRVKTDVLDMNMRAKKTIEWAEITGKNVSSITINEGLVESPVFPVSHAGRARPKFTGTDMEIKISGTSYAGAVLEEMQYRWKLSDKSSIRGAYASNAVTRTTG